MCKLKIRYHHLFRQKTTSLNLPLAGKSLGFEWIIGTHSIRVLRVGMVILCSIIASPYSYASRLADYADESINRISGIIRDIESNEVIPFAYVHLEEVNRTTTSDIDGFFELNNIPRGEFHLTVHRLGYKTRTLSIVIDPSEQELQHSEQPIIIYLEPILFSGESVLVEANQLSYQGSEIEHVSEKIQGSELRANLNMTLAQTIATLPGIDQATNGVSTARPVIRGLGEERVQIRQDGVLSGDISSQSSDHSVTIDASSAQEVQIARGPAALQYGSNAVGGIVNVVKNTIPTTLARNLNGSYTTRFSSSVPGLSTAFDVQIPIPSRSMAITLNSQGQSYGDSKTPLGSIENSFNQSYQSTLGMSHFTKWGYLGASFAVYNSNYGIPPNPDGHVEGVDIEMTKYQFNGKSEILLNNSDITSISINVSLNQYAHQEFESADIIGSEFGLLTQSIKVQAHHDQLAWLQKGSFGIEAQHQDYAVNGANTPDSESMDFGFFFTQTTDLSDIHTEWGFRIDYANRKPEVSNPNSDIGHIRTRDFISLSSAISASWNFNKDHPLQAVFLHSFRAPSLEELYSEGPHLASYSFEIGNPDLSPERAFAKELSYSMNTSRFEVTLSAYHNYFTNYNFAVNTGIRNNRFPSLLNYQFEGVQAKMRGLEAEFNLKLLTQFSIGLNSHYLLADIKNNNENTWTAMPYSPPMQIRSNIKYTHKLSSAGLGLTYAAKQNRIGEFETTTEEYTKIDLFLQHEWMRSSMKSFNGLHSLHLRAENLFDSVYYNHLSRIKYLSPELGRGFYVMYRYYF